MSLNIQRFLAALVVDPQLFLKFRESKLECAKSFGLNLHDAHLVATTDAAQLAIFRDVVEGTRAIQFQGWFPSLASAIDQEFWIHLIQDFHAEVCIRSAKRFNDANLFCKWVASRFPSSVAQDMVIHDLAVVIASGAFRPSWPGMDADAPRTSCILSDGAYCTLRPDAVPFSLQRPIDKLHQAEVDIFIQHAEQGLDECFFYLVHVDRTGVEVADTLKISELDSPTFAFLMQLFVPPWQQLDQAQSPPITVGEGVAIEALIDAQVLMTRDAQL